MNIKTLMMAAVVLLAGVNACGPFGCQKSTTVLKSNLNGGVKENGQGLTSGQDLTTIGGVNVNGNNGPGLFANHDSVIANVYKGNMNVNTGGKGTITTSGKQGTSTQNSGLITNTKKESVGTVGTTVVNSSTIKIAPTKTVTSTRILPVPVAVGSRPSVVVVGNPSVPVASTLVATRTLGGSIVSAVPVVTTAARRVVVPVGDATSFVVPVPVASK